MHLKCTSQRWAGWRAAVVPVWEGCPQLPGLLRSCPLVLQQEVVHSTSLHAVGARDCASGGGGFQEQDDFLAMRTATKMRAICLVYGLATVSSQVQFKPMHEERAGWLGTHKKPSLYRS